MIDGVEIIITSTITQVIAVTIENAIRGTRDIDTVAAPIRAVRKRRGAAVAVGVAIEIVAAVIVERRHMLWYALAFNLSVIAQLIVSALLDITFNLSTWQTVQPIQRQNFELTISKRWKFAAWGLRNIGPPGTTWSLQFRNAKSLETSGS